nr:MAK10-like protein [Tanacetum cinerariifolium]
MLPCCELDTAYGLHPIWHISDESALVVEIDFTCFPGFGSIELGRPPIPLSWYEEFMLLHWQNPVPADLYCPPEENPRHTLGDYSRPSHEGYQNTIEVLNGNDLVPLRSDTIRRRTIDQAAGGKLRDKNDENHRLLEDLALYNNKSQNNPRDFTKLVKAISMPHDVMSTSDRLMLELEDQINYLIRKQKTSSTQPPPYQANVVKRFEEAMIRRKEKLEERMDDMLKLVKKLMSSLMPKKVLVREESRQPSTKNVNVISLCKTKKDEGEKHKQIIVKSMVELNNDVNKPVETSHEPFRNSTKEFVGEERKMAEILEPQPVSFCLNHKINEKLIRGLSGNLRFNDSLLAIETGKMKCGDYYSLPRKYIRKAIMFKRVTRKMGMEGNFVTRNVRGTKDMSALVDQGSDVNIMPLSVYNRLTDEKLVETDVRLALANIKEDVKNPLILGTPFLTMARAEIKFDKGTISLRSGKKNFERENNNSLQLVETASGFSRRRPHSSTGIF